MQAEKEEAERLTGQLRQEKEVMEARLDEAVRQREADDLHIANSSQVQA